MDAKRASRPFSFRLPPGTYRLGSQFTPGVKVLLGLLTLTCLLSYLPGIRAFIGEYLMLRPAQALGARPWQLLTGTLLPLDFLQLLFSGLLLYSIGSAVEQALSMRRLLMLVLWASLGAGLCAAAAGRLVPGFHDRPVQMQAVPIYMALLASFSRLYGAQQVSPFGMGQLVSGKVLSYFLIGLGILLCVLHSDWLEALAACVAVGVGLLLGTGLSPGLEVRRLLRRLRARLLRRRYRVIEGGLHAEPGDGRSVRPRGKQPEKRWMN